MFSSAKWFLTELFNIFRMLVGSPYFVKGQPRKPYQKKLQTPETCDAPPSTTTSMATCMVVLLP